MQTKEPHDKVLLKDPDHSKPLYKPAGDIKFTLALTLGALRVQPPTKNAFGRLKSLAFRPALF